MHHAVPFIWRYRPLNRLKCSYIPLHFVQSMPLESPQHWYKNNPLFLSQSDPEPRCLEKHQLFVFRKAAKLRLFWKVFEDWSSGIPFLQWWTLLPVLFSLTSVVIVIRFSYFLLIISICVSSVSVSRVFWNWGAYNSQYIDKLNMLIL